MQQTATPETISEAVSFGPRFVALVIDIVILAVVGVVVQFVFNQAISGLINLIVGIAYYVGFWTTQGATPGKMAMGLKVVDKSTRQLLDPGKAFIRWIGYIISGVALGLRFLWVLWDPEREGWHDKIAGTRVIRAK